MQATSPVPNFEIRFRSLFSEGRALSFPCDSAGQVLFEQLTESALSKFTQAWALVGSEFGIPSVEPSDPH